MLQRRIGKEAVRRLHMVGWERQNKVCIHTIGMGSPVLWVGVDDRTERRQPLTVELLSADQDRVKVDYDRLSGVDEHIMMPFSIRCL